MPLQYAEDSFILTGTGFAGLVSGLVTYTRVGNIVNLTIPFLTGTSNATTLTLVGVPSWLIPAHTAYFAALITDDGMTAPGQVRIKLGGFLLGSLTWSGIVVDGGERAFLLRGTISGTVSFGVTHQTCVFEGRLGSPSTAQTPPVEGAPTDRFHVCAGTSPGADQTVDNTLLVTAQFSAAHADIYLVKESAHLVRLPN